MDKQIWIPVADSLPDENVPVLVYVEHSMYGKERSSKMDITIGKLTDGKWKCARFLGNRVLAWMRLPEPPAVLG